MSFLPYLLAMQAIAWLRSAAVIGRPSRLAAVASTSDNDAHDGTRAHQSGNAAVLRFGAGFHFGLSGRFACARGAGRTGRATGADVAGCTTEGTGAGATTCGSGSDGSGTTSLGAGRQLFGHNAQYGDAPYAGVPASMITMASTVLILAAVLPRMQHR